MSGEHVQSNRFARETLAMRAATKADLDAITRVVQVSFPDDPGCNYKFPYRYEYPEDFWKWTRLEYEEYLDQPEKFAVNVVTAPVTEFGGVVVDEPIAIGIWDIAVETKSTGGDHGINERRDANAEHMRVYAEAMSRSFQSHFAKYGKEQLRLWMLFTHPDFRRRGAGTMLCNWGEEESEERGAWILTLEASPMGEALYKHLGYELVGTEKAQVDGEDELVNIYSMEKKK